MFPKSWHCQTDRGGSDLCQDFFGGFVQNALRALQCDHLSSPSFPQHGSFNHIYLTFSLLKIIYTLLSKNVQESHLRAFVGEIRQDTKIYRWGL